jgi:hypothetical protein
MECGAAEGGCLHHGSSLQTCTIYGVFCYRQVGDSYVDAAQPFTRTATLSLLCSEDVIYVASGRRVLTFDRRCGSIVMKVCSVAPALPPLIYHQAAQASSAAARGSIACIDATATELVVCDDSGHVATLSVNSVALQHHSVGGEAHGNIARCFSRIASAEICFKQILPVLSPGILVLLQARQQRLPVLAWTERYAVQVRAPLGSH